MVGSRCLSRSYSVAEEVAFKNVTVLGVCHIWAKTRITKLRFLIAVTARSIARCTRKKTRHNVADFRGTDPGMKD